MSSPSRDPLLSATMSLIRTDWMFWLFMAICAPAVQPMTASQSSLSCNVTEQPDGSFRYLLSESPASPDCKTDWEDKNRTVVATDSYYNETLVQNLTSRSIVLRHCWDYLHYGQDCNGEFQEAHCYVNCSVHLDMTSQTNTVNSTLTCIYKSWCPDQLTIGLSITGIIALAACICGCCYFWKLIKRRRQKPVTMTSSYTRANEAMVELEKVVII